MKNKEGLAFPCLKEYYVSAQLKILYCWCNHDYQATGKKLKRRCLFKFRLALGSKDLLRIQWKQEIN